MFQGNIVALLTPMDAAQAVDESAWCNLLDYQLDNGTNGLVVCGTTGESPTITGDEFQRLLSLAVRQAEGRVPVIAGSGTADTAKSVQRSCLAAELGADGVLVVTPYYNRPMQSGLEAHFRAVADACPVPVIMYNVPSRTAVDLLPETVARLAGHPSIAAIKEAVPDPRRVRRLRELCGSDLDILSGDDGSCRAAMAEGAVGVISVAANIAPAHMSGLTRAAAGGDDATADRLDQELRELFAQLGVETNPIPVKWAACRMGLIGPGIRMPLLALEPAHHAALEACLVRVGLLSPDKMTTVC